MAISGVVRGPLGFASSETPGDSPACSPPAKARLLRPSRSNRVGKDRKRSDTGKKVPRPLPSERTKCEGAPGSLATLATDRGPSHPAAPPPDHDCRRFPAESCKSVSTTVAVSESRIKRKSPAVASGAPHNHRAWRNRLRFGRRRRGRGFGDVGLRLGGILAFG